MDKKIVFCGTPQISVRCIQALVDLGIKPVLVITQPDKIVGRKKEVVFSPVKQYCIDNNINYLQPIKIKEVEEEIKKANPDILLTCAYGQFIPESILSIPKYYSINIHASLLPKHRGGAPIHWSIINGDKETGITIMEMIKQMDAGDIFYVEKLKIEDDDTLDSLFNKMEDLAYLVVKKYINNFFSKDLPRIKQDEKQVSFSYNITREDEKIDFNKSAIDIHNLIRGLCSVPAAYCLFDNKIVKVYKSKVLDHKTPNKKCGEIIELNNDGIVITTKDNDIVFTDIKLEGKNRVSDKQIKNYQNLFVIKKVFE